MTRWLDPEPVDPSSLDELNLIPLIAEALIRRGFNTPRTAQAFLDPAFSDTFSANLLPGMDKAVDCISRAIHKNQPICAWGDFDVDGQTSTTILVQTLQSLGANVTYHIPNRARESHGVNLENLTPIIDNGARLIITCDTGISAVEEAVYSRSRGVDFVITDHHDLPDQLPDAAAIVNPKLLSSGHPLADLPGAGVAYKLAEALIEQAGEISSGDFPLISPDSLLDLAALGIIADLASLKGETRTLAQKGIAALRNTERLGLKTIAGLARIDLSQATEETIGFDLGPRLNALGRLRDANPAVELFLTKDPSRARALAAEIDGLNIQRRLLTEQVVQAAEAQLHDDPSLLTQPLILISHPSWPGGILGIVAGHLVERYHKAVILMTGSNDGVLRGSARSVEGLNITAAITANKEYLLGFGGHPMAAGLSLMADALPDFQKAINKTVENMLGDLVKEEPVIQVDSWLELSSISLDLAKSIEVLAPFGPGNPPLVFASHGLNLQSESRIGKTKEHRRLVIANGQGEKQEVIWWNSGNEDLPDSLSNPGAKFDLAYTVRANTYRGERRLSLEFVDFHITEQKPVEIHKPKFEIIDFRLQPHAHKLPASCLIWAEGSDKSEGKNRFELREAAELAIWTTPPSPIELRNALETVKPETIYLVAIIPSEQHSNITGGSKTDQFLSHLAGLAKFSINQRDGMVKISELAAVTAHREITIRLGLEWLAAGGHLTLEEEDGDYHIKTGEGEANPYLQKELYIVIKGLLEETAAYRAHFARAEANSIFSL